MLLMCLKDKTATRGKSFLCLKCQYEPFGEPPGFLLCSCCFYISNIFATRVLAFVIDPSFRVFLLLWGIQCWCDVGKMLRSPTAFPRSCRQGGVCLEMLFASSLVSHTEQCQLTSLATAYLYWQISINSICFISTFCWCSWSFAFTVFNQLSLKTDVQIWAFLFADIRRCSAATPLPSFDNTIIVLLLLDELQPGLNGPCCFFHPSCTPWTLAVCSCLCLVAEGSLTVPREARDQMAPL